jgi:hypothetical protein
LRLCGSKSGAICHKWRDNEGNFISISPEGKTADMTTNLNKRPGCLASLFKLQKSNDPKKLPYRLRDNFLTPAEFSFYKVLTSIVGTRMVTLTKVRLADIFFVPHQQKNFGYVNRISNKHVDFLLCTPDTMKSLAGIELDDVSHNQPSRQQRDNFVDEVFLTAGLPLLHIPVQRGYNLKEISAQLEELFLTHQIATIPQAAAISVSSSEDTKHSMTAIPLCPKCGLPMVLRTANKGDRKGQQFYGCSNFPDCREVMQIPRTT